jgi:hypothetical protein
MPHKKNPRQVQDFGPGDCKNAQTAVYDNVASLPVDSFILNDDALNLNVDSLSFNDELPNFNDESLRVTVEAANFTGDFGRLTVEAPGERTLRPPKTCVEKTTPAARHPGPLAPARRHSSANYASYRYFFVRENSRNSQIIREIPH